MHSITSVEELATIGAVLPFVRNNPVDLIVLDISLPDGNGLSLLAELSSGLGLRVVILTGQESPAEIDLARRLGADGLVLKSDPSEEIISCIQAVLNGQKFESSGAKKIISKLGEPKINLSPRQTAILHLLALGETNKEVAHRLGIAMNTVSFHLLQIRNKMGVDNNKRILISARSLGLV